MRLPIAEAVDLDVPAAWEDATLVTFLGAPTDDGRPSLVVGRDALSGQDVEAYARGQLERLRRETAGFQAHAGALDDQGRFVAEHTFAVSGRPPVRQIQVYAARGDVVYTLSLTHAAASFSAARPTLAGIAASFRAR